MQAIGVGLYHRRAITRIRFREYDGHRIKDAQSLFHRPYVADRGRRRPFGIGALALECLAARSEKLDRPIVRRSFCSRDLYTGMSSRLSENTVSAPVAAVNGIRGRGGISKPSSMAASLNRCHRLQTVDSTGSSGSIPATCA